MYGSLTLASRGGSILPSWYQSSGLMSRWNARPFMIMAMLPVVDIDVSSSGIVRSSMKDAILSVITRLRPDQRSCLILYQRIIIVSVVLQEGESFLSSLFTKVRKIMLTYYQLTI